MAFTVSVAPTLAVGSSVKAYPATGWLPGDLPPAPGSTPKGSAADTQTVAAAGTWTSSSLSEDTDYYLTVDGTAYVHVRPDQTAAGLNVTSLPSLPAGTASIGTVKDPDTTPDNIRKVTVTAGTRVPISATPLRVRRAMACALATNTGVVVVGGASVVATVATRNSPFLNSGDTQDLGTVDLAATYLDSTVNGEGVTVYYEA